MNEPEMQAVERPVETTTGTEAQAEVQETAADKVEPSAEEVRVMYENKAQVLERLRELVANEEVAERQELDSLKQTYYRLQKAESMDAYRQHIDGGGEPETFQNPVDETESEFKGLMTQIRARRAEIAAEQDRIKSENLEKKLHIIERVKQLGESPETANQSFDELRALQAQWKEIGVVPPEQATTVWRTYQHYVEQFYDLLKMNNELREYDFKKNLEIKTRLCEQAEALADVEDVQAALKQLQSLHAEWKETGPVARELREELWTRFKDASTVINKRHQDYFIAIKSAEEENLAKKEELCKLVEEINFDEFASVSAWEDATKEVIAYQAKWRTIGFATPKMHAAVFNRFREACDKFFAAKSQYFKTMRESQQANLEAKTRLCEQAEELMNSQEWRATAAKMQALQQEWKQVGAVAHKVSEQLWTRFRTACDTFFAAKSEADKQAHSVEQENLSAKRGIIEQLQALVESTEEDVIAKVKELQAAWNEIGHVPFRDKDKVFGEYRELCDKLYKQFGRRQAGRRLDGFRRNIQATAQQGATALQRERERMLRIRDNMKAEIQTYENNLGFLSASSKSGNSLVDQMRRKAEKLKEELALHMAKIKELDAEIRKEGEKAE